MRIRQYSIRRLEFDHFLNKRSGVPVVQHLAKRMRKANDRYIIDDEYRCKYLVGAGGTNCRVYRIFFGGIKARAKEN